MKIAFFWTAEFSAAILKTLSLYEDIQVHFVVSQEDKRVGRKKELQKTAVKCVAEELGIRVFQPKSLKEECDFETISSEVDFYVVVAYGKIIPQRILDIPKYWSINLHGSLLPKYRGASPVQEALKNGDSKTWLTTMYMSAWMDEGDMLLSYEININNEDRQRDIFMKFMDKWPALLYDTFAWIVNESIQAVEQKDSDATYCGKILKSDGELDFYLQTGAQVYNLFRAYDPWPGIFSFYKWKKLSIIDCELINSEGKEIWVLQEYEKGMFWICWADRKILRIKKLKLEWKKTLDILDFINGNSDFIDYKF